MIILFWLLSWLIPQPAVAADNIGKLSGNGFSITPSTIMVDLEKQDSQVVSMEIANNTSKEATFDLKKVDFGTMDESGGVVFLGLSKDELERKYGLASWIILPKDRVTVPAGGKEKLEITIDNRDTLGPGGHYGAVLSTLETDEKNKDQVNIQQSSATLIMVKKIGGEIDGLALKEIQPNGNWLNFSQKVGLRFENFGNVHLIPYGRVEIKDSLGNEVARGILNEDSQLIMPESFRLYNTSINIEKKLLFPGNYTMKVFFRYGSQDNFETKETNFYYLGKWNLVMVLSVTIIFGLSISIILRHLKAKNNRKI